MKKHFIYWLALGFLVITGCQKELSFEQGSTPAVGTLQNDLTGDCLPKTVNGTYVAATALVPATNTITIQVDVTRTGIYTITTDTVNGYYFRATGTFTTLGINTVTLRSNGTPFASGINNFVVSYNGNTCDIAITVLPAGAGGPAVFTLDGAGGGCTSAAVNGSYGLGLLLSPTTNTVTIGVNVTTLGTWNISTTFQGMTFAAAGTFTTLGPQGVTLNGSGTPTTAGLNTVPITVGANTCSFPVTVLPPAVGTLGSTTGACLPISVNGTYTKDLALTAANTVQVQINVTTAGVYNITTNTVAGFHFSGTGTVAIGAGQSITLAGGGTPTASGPQTFTVTFGTSTCTFVVNVVGAPVQAVFSAICAGATVNGNYQAGTALTSANTIVLPITVTTAGTYNISTTLTNGMIFTGSGSLTLSSTSITLTGNGSTPIAAATPSNIPMPGTTACSVPVTVTPAAGGVAVFAANCAGATVNGNYQAGTALTGANTIVLPITVTTAGTYNISTTLTNGMVFTGSGSLALSSTSITLTGLGSTPVAAASPSNIPMPGTAACTVPVTVTGTVTIDWSFKIGTTTYQGQNDIPNTEYNTVALAPISYLDYYGDNVGGDQINITLVDLAGGITSPPNEQYVSTSDFTVINGAFFYFTDGANTLDLRAEPPDVGPPPVAAVGNMTFVVTSHSIATKTIIGTFTGTAFDAISGTTKTITFGTFKAVYP